MKLFRRSKKVQPNVPPEVAEYYQAERKQRHGVAWLMTLMTLLVTVAIVVGLFLAGRWIYRAARDKNDRSTAVKTTQNESKKQTENTTTQSSSAGDSESSSASGSTSTQGTNSTRGTSDTDSVRSSGDGSSGSSAGQTPAPSQSTTPPATSLTNTGPGDSALIVFVFVSLFSYAVYRHKLINQQN